MAARDGRDVLLLERFEVGHAGRLEPRAAHAHLPVASRDARYGAFALEALPWWRTLEDECGQSLLDHCGQLDHGSRHAARRGRGVAEGGRAAPCERLSGGRSRPPVAGHPHRRRGRASRPTVGSSPRTGRWPPCTRRAAERGATIRTGQAARGIEFVDGERRVHTDDGSWSAPVLVVAAGAWAAPLLGGLVELPPLSVTLATPSRFLPTAGLEHMAKRRAPRARRGGARIRRSWSPVWALRRRDEGRAREREPTIDPNNRPATVPSDALADLVSYVRESFPGLDPEPLDRLSLFAGTADEHFVLDRRALSWSCTPCSGHRFKFVPAIGRLAADLAEAPGSNTASVRREDAWRLRFRVRPTSLPCPRIGAMVRKLGVAAGLAVLVVATLMSSIEAKSPLPDLNSGLVTKRRS